MTSERRTNHREGGNILFLILLAVVLFAALSYAITSGMRGGGKDASAEKLQSQASQLLNYGALVENTITRMRLSGNVPEYGLDFDDGTGPSTATANGTCTNATCHVFSSAMSDGQMSPIKFDESFVDPALRAGNPGFGGGSGTTTRFMNIHVTDVGTSLPDTVMIISGLGPALCDTLNSSLVGSATHPAFSYAATSGDCTTLSVYSGTLTTLPTTGCNTLGGIFRGKTAGCVGRDSANVTTPYYGGDFFYVVMAR